MVPACRGCAVVHGTKIVSPAGRDFCPMNGWDAILDKPIHGSFQSLAEPVAPFRRNGITGYTILVGNPLGSLHNKFEQQKETLKEAK